MTGNVQPLLATKDLSKLFGGVVALDKFDLEVFPNQILCLANRDRCVFEIDDDPLEAGAHHDLHDRRMGKR